MKRFGLVICYTTKLGHFMKNPPLMGSTAKCNGWEFDTFAIVTYGEFHIGLCALFIIFHESFRAPVDCYEKKASDKKVFENQFW